MSQIPILEERIAQLHVEIAKADKIVFFGGAGVSTESGIPDFRSSKGLYATEFEGYAPEYLLSHNCFEHNSDLFFRYYKKHLMYPEAKPNGVHRFFAALEQEGKKVSVVTQNIDSLHQVAGSKTVYELHGAAQRNYCTRCHQFYDGAYVYQSDGIPR